jgi:hypothetical protein
MELLLAEVPVTVLRTLQAGLSSRVESSHLERIESDQSDDLREYLRYAESWPAIRIEVGADGINVIDRAELVRIAEEMDRGTLSAVIDVKSDPVAVSQLLSQPGVHRVEADDTLKQPVVRDWQVFRLAKSATTDDLESFKRGVVQFLEDLRMRYPSGLYPDDTAVTDFEYKPDRRVIAFRAWLPIGDESWYSEYLERVRAFASQNVPILSFQGVKM